MPRIRLRVEQRVPQRPCLVRAPDGAEVVVPMLRLMANVFVGSGAGRREPLSALADTGAYLSALQPATWHDLDRLGLIEHVPFADGTETKSASLGGATDEYRLGRLAVVASGPTDDGRIGSLPPVSVLAQLFMQTNPLLNHYPLILGFYAGVLEGVRLRREPVDPRPGPVPNDRRGDCGAWFGQEWYLESA